MARSNGFAFALLCASLLSFTGCSSGGGDSGGSSQATMAVSGTLQTGTVSFTALDQLADVGVRKPSLLDVNTLAYTNYGVRCVTLASTPQAGEGQCDSNGNFSLSLAAATNVPIGCFVISGSGATASIVATLAFESSSTGLNGGATRDGSYVAGNGTSGLTMGSITLDVNKGLAVVPKSQVVLTGGTVGTVAGTFTDMTGEWAISALGSVPPGYKNAGPDDDGPRAGQVIHIGYYTATDASAGVHHGLSIWKEASSLAACGGEGITLPVGWALTPNTSPNNKMTTAASVTTTFPLPSTVHIGCQGGQHFAGLAAGACTGANGGNDWQATAMCSNILSSPYSNGTAWSVGSCDGGGDCTLASSHWGLTPVKAAFLCTLNGIRQAAGSCGGEVDIDWAGLWAGGDPFTGIGFTSVWTGLPTASVGTDSVTYFGNHIRFNKSPSDRFLMNEFIVNGSVGSLTDHHDFTMSACANYGTNGNCMSSPIACHVAENSKLTITQIDATHANVELTQVRSVSATDDAVCSSDTRNRDKLGQDKWMFTLTKQ